ncbi:fatty acid-binding protein, liver-like [Aethina tumida]|uniref:fatty acid-binding protein, liver-like n=1 Tax=Aethina tumida TaxID=116153 RepID=UPI0021484372|nr:fatty acid-binding protein, liver-like [Aethina tumida]
MVQIAGKYSLKKNENFVPYLVALGIEEEKAKVADGLQNVEIEVIIDGNNITINSNSGIGNSSSKFIVGQEVDDPMPLGITLKSTAKLESDAIIVDSKGPDGSTGQRIYKFTDAGLTITYTSSKGPEAKRIYKRL